MPYYAGDHAQRYRIRMSGRMYRVGDPGFFDFLKKAVQGVGSVVGKVASLAAPIVSLVPGVGGIVGSLLSKGGELLARARGGAIGQVAEALAPLVSGAEGGGRYQRELELMQGGATEAEAAAMMHGGGTPGIAAATAKLSRGGRGRGRSRYVRHVRRRRRY